MGFLSKTAGAALAFLTATDAQAIEIGQLSRAAYGIHGSINNSIYFLGEFTDAHGRRIENFVTKDIAIGGMCPWQRVTNSWEVGPDSGTRYSILKGTCYGIPNMPEGLKGIPHRRGELYFDIRQIEIKPGDQEGEYAEHYMIAQRSLGNTIEVSRTWKPEEKIVCYDIALGRITPSGNVTDDTMRLSCFEVLNKDYMEGIVQYVDKIEAAQEKQARVQTTAPAPGMH
jgi:hypothetical protein